MIHDEFREARSKCVRSLAAKFIHTNQALDYGSRILLENAIVLAFNEGRAYGVREAEMKR